MSRCSKLLTRPAKALALLLLALLGGGIHDSLAAGCSQASTPGPAAPPDWATYCWLDFSSYSDAMALSPGGQPFTFTLPDGSTLAFTAMATGPAGGVFNAVAAPSFVGAAMGNTAFLGIKGKPVLYMAQKKTNISITFSQISLTPPPGAPPATVYSFVAADAEETNVNETLVFTTNGAPWTILAQLPAPGSTGLYPTVTNTGTTFTEQGLGTGAAGVGAYVVSSLSPSQVKAAMTTLNGRQGAMFAVRYASVTLNKSLTNGRTNPNDQFTYNITGAYSATALASSTTSGTGNGPFTAASQLITSAQSLTVQETMAPGSVNTLNAYTPSLTCINAATHSSTAMPTNVAATSYVFRTINLGDAISCLFTNAKRAISILPEPDSGTAVSAVPSTPIANVTANDTVNGAPATLGPTGNATIAKSGTWPSAITLNTTTGAVLFSGALPPGTYSFLYQLCDRNTPPNCATTTDTLKVTGSVIALPVEGTAIAGIPSTPIPNIVATDTSNHAPATLGLKGNSVVSAAGIWPAGLTLNPQTGAVSTSATLPAGTYVQDYQLCDRSTPPNCATSTATVIVKALIGGTLLISKVPNKTQAEIGDSVQYHLQVRNTGSAPVTYVRVTDTLPAGFKYILGTTLIGTEPAQPKKASDPAGSPGPILTWTLGVIAPAAIVDIYYQVRLGVGADKGTGINRAQAQGVDATSPVASAQVLVTPGTAFDTNACVVGKVYVDCNGNRMQDPGEPGIPGVRVYFEDGTNLISDENGNYSFCGLRPITHVLKVDPTTLPAGSRLVVLSSRNAGDGKSLFIDLRDGELHRADFAEGSCTDKVMEDVRRRHNKEDILAPLAPAGREHIGIDFESADGAPKKARSATVPSGNGDGQP
jgi:uncharacterized repeat protein (TIGR01451 family)